MSKKKKIIINIVIVGVILILSFSFVYILIDYELTPLLYIDLDNYDHYKDRLKNTEYTTSTLPAAVDEFLPVLNDLQAIDMDLYVLQFSKSSPNELSLNLIVSYSESNYKQEKELLMSTVEFVSEPIIDGKTVVLSHYECHYKGFEIRVVENKNFSYCAYFGMLGFNDETCQIAWLFYRDSHDTLMGEDKTLEKWLDYYFRFEITDELVES